MRLCAFCGFLWDRVLCLCVFCAFAWISQWVGEDLSAQQTLHRLIGDIGDILERLPHIHALGEHVSVAAEGTDIDNGDVDLTDLIHRVRVFYAVLGAYSSPVPE